MCFRFLFGCYLDVAYRILFAIDFDGKQRTLSVVACPKFFLQNIHECHPAFRSVDMWFWNPQGRAQLTSVGGSDPVGWSITGILIVPSPVKAPEK